jgi:cytochrome c-type biogenesis protein CcmH/NrfG
MEESSAENRTNNALWKPAQTYTMAAICLVIGVAIGYLVRGSASPAPEVVASASTTTQAQNVPAGMNHQQMPSLEDMKRMADKQAEPLLAKLKNDPKNVQLLNQTALTYKATHQFKDATSYFQKALDVDPKNVPIRTDMASCMFFSGDVDGALAELNKSLSYDPKHAGTLVNIGIIKWKGKNDPKGAVAVWETLLKENPNFEQKQAVEHMIAEVKQQQKAGKPVTPPKG